MAPDYRNYPRDWSVWWNWWNLGNWGNLWNSCLGPGCYPGCHPGCYPATSHIMLGPSAATIDWRWPQHQGCLSQSSIWESFRSLKKQGSLQKTAAFGTTRSVTMLPRLLKPPRYLWGLNQCLGLDMPPITLSEGQEHLFLFFVSLTMCLNYKFAKKRGLTTVRKEQNVNVFNNVHSCVDHGKQWI